MRKYIRTQLTIKAALLSTAFVLAAVQPVSAASAAELSADDLRSKLDSIFNGKEWASARWGVMVKDLTTSEVLYTHEEAKSFMPASNLKLYSTAPILDKLGADYQFNTTIHAAGTTNTRGVLKGDLVVTGSGDPAISGRYIDLLTSAGVTELNGIALQDLSTTAIIQQWAKAIKAAGIRRIEGSIIGDDNYFDEDYRAGSWQLDYFPEWYAAENSALSVNENCWDAVVSPGKTAGSPAVLTSLIPGKYVRFINNIRTVAPSSQAASGETSPTRAATPPEPSVDISRPLDSNDITLSGTIPLDARPAKLWGSLHNGTLFTVTLLAEELQKQGVTVRGGPADIDDLPAEKRDKVSSAPRVLLHTHKSPPLSAILAIVNKPSQNFYADQLLKATAVHYGKRPGFTGGLSAVKEFLKQAKADPASLRMSDGSGLSRQNMVEPRLTIALLSRMYEGPYFQAFLRSLPIMGVDGTLKSRLKNSKAQGVVMAKTGTINMVRSLSGYLTTTEGHLLAFSMMANNFTQPTRAATEAQDDALLAMISYSHKKSKEQAKPTPAPSKPSPTPVPAPPAPTQAKTTTSLEAKSTSPTLAIKAATTSPSLAKQDPATTSAAR